MKYNDYMSSYLSASVAVKEKLINDKALLSGISAVIEVIVNAYKTGNKVILAGNGGSAADSQHIAAEFVGRFNFDRDSLPAISLTTDTSMLTAIGNDYGFDKVFSRQLLANGHSGDVFIGISTSGSSSNIISAFDAAKSKGIISVLLTGDAVQDESVSDYVIKVPSSITSHIQEAHICIAHIICAIVENEMFVK